MKRAIGGDRGYILVELLFMLTIAAIVLTLLGKMLVDGFYLQRIASAREDRTAIVEDMIEQLRSDALSAAEYSWEADGETGTLRMTRTASKNDATEIAWSFSRGEIRRLEDGCDTGVFAAERLEFSLELEQGDRADLLAIRMIVLPPERMRQRDPQITEARVLLPSGSSNADEIEGVFAI